MLHRQTQDAYSWALKLVDSIPVEKWEEYPSGVETTVNWQIGHLIMSYYFHAVMCLAGHKKEVFAVVPLKEYDAYFNRGNPLASIGKINSENLNDQLRYVQDLSLSVIGELQDSDLSKPLEPTKFPNPVAKTKFEAIDWNIKHSMWHCGQLGLLKRAIDKRYDFWS